MSKQNPWVLGGGVVLALLIVYIAYRAYFTPPVQGPAGATVTTTVATSPTSTSSQQVFTGSGTLQGQGTTVVSGTPAAGLTADQIEAQLQAGITKKEAGDYADAAAIWRQLTVKAPQSYIAFADLGDLYMNFVKNYPLAESYYQRAINIQPTDIDLYRNLYTLYTWQSNIAAASSTIAAGLKANPGNSDLLQLQQQLQAGQ